MGSSEEKKLIFEDYKHCSVLSPVRFFKNLTGDLGHVIVEATAL